MSLGRKTLWTVGSGRGGVGKSLLAASIGAALARDGKPTIVVDANLASPNLHTSFGIKSPGNTLLEVLERHASPADALVPTCDPQLRFLACTGDDPGMADLSPSCVDRMAECISCLDAEHVVVDAGTGVSLSVLDFFNMADEPIVVATPDPESMQWAFTFVRNSIYRKVQKKFGSHQQVGAALRQMRQKRNTSQPKTMSDFFDFLRPAAPELIENIAETVNTCRPLLLINMASGEQDSRLAEIIQSAARKFLNVDLRFCGMVQYDSELCRAAQRKSAQEYIVSDRASAGQIRRIVQELAGDGTRRNESGISAADDTFQAMPTMGLNDNFDFMGRGLHIQTEDLGDGGHYITTNVFCDGRVILSTKSEYPAALRDPKYSSQMVELMRAQHFNVIRELENRKMKDPSAPA